MKYAFRFVLAGIVVCTLWTGEGSGRGFGGFHGSFSGGWSGARGGMYGGSYSGSRSFSGYSGWRTGGASGSYDRSYTDARGESISTEGSRSAGRGFFGGGAASSSRTVSATTASGQTYSHASDRSAAVGPRGRYVGGSSHYGSTSGPHGSYSTGWQSAFAGRAYPTAFGGAHYGTYAVAGAHGTAYWSHGYMGTRAAAVRTGFGYYHCFHPTWFAAHPDCWHAAAWTGAAAWRTATWASVAAFCGMAAGGGGGGDGGDSEPADYDYGSNIVYQNDDVYYGGQQVATAQQYAQQATDLADQGQKADAPPNDEWKALGVFALVQGDEKTSNNIFQLAINKEGVIRGNYYDGLMDTTTQVYGAVNKQNQRAAWTIGKDNKRVFETGLGSLTKDEASVLVHIGTGATQQSMLVRVPPSNGGNQPSGAN